MMSESPIVFSQGVAPTRWGRALSAIGAGTAFYELGKKAYVWGRSRTTFSVAVEDTDDLYDLVHAWLINQLPPEKRKAVTVKLSRRSDEVTVDSGGRSEPAHAHQVFDGSTPQTLIIEGQRVIARVEKEEGASKIPDQFRVMRARILFTASNLAGRDAVVALLDRLAAERSIRPPRLFTVARWGDWAWVDMPPRRPETVILAAGQMEAILADVDKFIANEARYVALGLPWHRGYLLHGPPGSGKTSLARALAHHAGMDAYYLPLSGLPSDVHLVDLFARVPPRSLILLEDIDVVHAASSRDDAENPNKLSLSGLLNALDGVATPHGVVTVFTTNGRPDELDEALIRPGRADQIIEFGYLDDDQLNRLATMAAGMPLAETGTLVLNGAKVTAAQLVGVCKEVIDQPDLVHEVLRAYLPPPGYATGGLITRSVPLTELERLDAIEALRKAFPG